MCLVRLRVGAPLVPPPFFTVFLFFLFFCIDYRQMERIPIELEDGSTEFVLPVTGKCQICSMIRDSIRLQKLRKIVLEQMMYKIKRKNAEQSEVWSIICDTYMQSNSVPFGNTFEDIDNGGLSDVLPK